MDTSAVGGKITLKALDGPSENPADDATTALRSDPQDRQKGRINAPDTLPIW